MSADAARYAIRAAWPEDLPLSTMAPHSRPNSRELSVNRLWRTARWENCPKTRSSIRDHTVTTTGRCKPHDFTPRDGDGAPTMAGK
jgi:hypothetical protein